MNNRYVLDIGGPRDNRSLPLSTKKGTHIPNVQHAEAPAEKRTASIETWSKYRPSVQLRSWSSTYNCMGLVFANRRTHVGTDSLAMVLREDGYRRLAGPDEAALGDVVVYALKGEIQHVGLVARIEVDLGKGLRDLWVLSKWGSDGEYLHQLRDVPASYGTPTEYWTERRQP